MPELQLPERDPDRIALRRGVIKGRQHEIGLVPTEGTRRGRLRNGLRLPLVRFEARHP